MPKTTFFWNGIFLVLLWARTTWLAGIVPPEVPVHFDGSGRPDRWGSPETLYLLPGIATALTALLLGIGASLPGLARAGGDWINLPKKKVFVALPVEARVRVVAPLGAMLGWVALGAGFLFLWILEESGRIAIAGRFSDATLPWTPMTLPIVVILGLVGGFWVRVARAIEVEAAEAARTGAVAGPPPAR